MALAALLLLEGAHTGREHGLHPNCIQAPFSSQPCTTKRWPTQHPNPPCMHAYNPTCKHPTTAGTHQVAGLVHVVPAQAGEVVGQQLQGQDVDHGLQGVVHAGHCRSGVGGGGGGG
jgi:hypothetical protein